MATARVSGFDRFNDALKSLDEQLQDLRERFDHQRQRVEREVRKRAEQVQERVQASDLYKRAEQGYKDLGSRVDETRTQIYDVFGIASKAEVDKLHKRLNKISKQIADLSEGKPVSHSEAV
ncbi:MAG TPA: phasin family protein [Myxococcota bacterium]|nr:phasin family protein [Myxococcota bacterium]